MYHSLLQNQIEDNINSHIFRYGSKVYDVVSQSSDEDFIIIRKQEHDEVQTSNNNINITYWSPKHFQYKIDGHDISALECLFLDSKHILKSTHNNFKFDLNLQKLRRSLSQKSSNSFVKCKKKLEKEKEYYIGKKSLFHSLRIIIFGLQIVKYGKIVDYSDCIKKYWEDIVMCDVNEWSYFKEKYQSIYNSLHSEFRLKAPL